ncbi:MAG: hypothetical protein ACFFCS_16110 [Candidatus Hodarchaeota archaeon]
MEGTMIWDPIEHLLWGAIIAFGIILSIFYIIIGIKKENKREMTLTLGFGLFFLCMTISRIFLVLADLQVEGEFINYTFYGDYSVYGPYYEVLNLSCQITSGIGSIQFFFLIERLTKRTRYIGTISGILVIIICLLFPLDLCLKLINNFIAPVWVFVVILSFLKVARHTHSKFKQYPVLIIIGFLMGVIAISLTNKNVKGSNLFPLSLSPLSFLFAEFSFFFALIIKPKNISRFVSFSILLALVLVTGVAILVMYYLYPPLMIVTLIAAPICIYSLLKVIKRSQVGIQIQVDDKIQKLSTLFARPQKVTEEEISVSKDKQICLVCKVELQRDTYICPECKAFYCQQCSNALKGLENACWVCNTPFDPEKPVHLPKPGEAGVPVVSGPDITHKL